MKVPKLGKAASVPVSIYPAFSSFFFGRGCDNFWPISLSGRVDRRRPKAKPSQRQPKAASSSSSLGPGAKGGKEADPATPSNQEENVTDFFL